MESPLRFSFVDGCGPGRTRAAQPAGPPQDANRLLCLNLATGDLLWQNDLRPCTGGIAVNGDVVHVGGWRGYTLSEQ